MKHEVSQDNTVTMQGTRDMAVRTEVIGRQQLGGLNPSLLIQGLLLQQVLLTGIDVD